MKATDRYRVADVTCELSGQSHLVLNLSVGGFFIATDRPPGLGQLVELSMTLPEREPFKVVGRVSWVNREEPGMRRELPGGSGIKITKIDFPNKLAIVDYLKGSQAATARSIGDRGRP